MFRTRPFSSFAFLCICIVFFSSDSRAQNLESNSLTDNGAVYFSLHFHQGDTLTYRVEARDSIIVDLDPAIIKLRYERVQITCDSIGKNSHYYLKQSTTQYMAFESRGEVRNIKRDYSPWVGRWFQIEIDSLGNRYKYQVDDSTRVVSSTGGAFQPYLLIPIVEDQKNVKESWSVSRTEELPENGFPAPLLRYDALYRATNPIDTLGLLCDALTYVKTGQGNVKIESKDINIDFISIINSGGYYYLSREFKIPVFLYGTSEQKVKVKQKNGRDMPIWHYTNISYTLDKYVKSGKTLYITPDSNPTDPLKK